jgi:DNA helicase IV
MSLASGDVFEFAEEQQLFYVALTRARSTVTHKEPPFITELMKDYAIGVFNTDGTTSNEKLCPTCGKGFFWASK